MCDTCGCNQPPDAVTYRKPGGHDHPHRHGDLEHAHPHEHPHDHGHPHDHDHQHDHDHPHDHDHGGARRLAVEQDILRRNDLTAERNRGWFEGRGVLALNLVSSPGSGKTSLLERTIRDLRDEIPLAVIEGDQQTLNDAERIAAAGAPVLQVNTGFGCHLDAEMIRRALADLEVPAGGVLLIENVGNLVCPAAFDLGEHHKVAILSVTEGEDKPLKYPDMFAAADVMLLNKCDLLPYLQFDADLAEANARRVNPHLTIFRVSATTGDGMAAWLDWIRAGLAAQHAKRHDHVDALKARIAELERQLAAR